MECDAKPPFYGWQVPQLAPMLRNQPPAESPHHLMPANPTLSDANHPRHMKLKNVLFIWQQPREDRSLTVDVFLLAPNNPQLSELPCQLLSTQALFEAAISRTCHQW